MVTVQKIAIVIWNRKPPLWERQPPVITRGCLCFLTGNTFVGRFGRVPPTACFYTIMWDYVFFSLLNAFDMWAPSKTPHKCIARQKTEATPGNYRGLPIKRAWWFTTNCYCTIFYGAHVMTFGRLARRPCLCLVCGTDYTVLLKKKWLSESNVKIDFPIYLGHFLLKIAFLRNVKIDFRVFEFFGGVNFWKKYAVIL